MPTNNESLQNILDALGKSIESIGFRIEQKNLELRKLREQRQDIVNSTVKTMLPNFSQGTYQTLLTSCPDFVNDYVTQAFRQCRPILGLFKRSGSEVELTALKTKFAFYMEQKNYFKLGTLNENSSAISAEIASLEKLLLETTEAYTALAKHLERGTPVSLDLQPHVAYLEANLREVSNSRKSKVTPILKPFNNRHETNSSSYTIEDNSDLWIYFAAHIPTSFRTILIHSYQQHVSSSAEMSVDREYETPTTSNNTINNAGLLSAPFVIDEIKTDDSLGNFS